MDSSINELSVPFETVVDSGNIGFNYTHSNSTTLLRSYDEDSYIDISDDMFSTLLKISRGELDVDEHREQLDNLAEKGYIRYDSDVREYNLESDSKLFSLGFYLLLVGIGVYAAFIYTQRSNLGSLFEVKNFLGIFLLTIISMTWHEYAHRKATLGKFPSEYSVKTKSGIIPVIATRVNDAWLYDSDIRRFIYAAGPLSDLFVAYVLAGIFLVTSDSFFIYTSLAMFSTVTSALSPVYESDGYWMACDTLGMHNILSKGRKDVLNLNLSKKAAYVVVTHSFIAFGQIAGILFLINKFSLVVLIPFVFSLIMIILGQMNQRTDIIDLSIRG